MIQMNKLKARMVEKGLSIAAVATAMGIDKSTLYRKFREPDKLCVGDVRQLAAILELNDTDAQSIFFA